MLRVLILMTTVLWICAASAMAGSIRIVAAESFYGRLAQDIGGSYVQVTSIMNNPLQDPHFFSNSPTTAKTISHADIILYNGLGYDPWVTHLIKNAGNTRVLIAGELAKKKMGDNPHIWYDPSVMLLIASRLSAELTRLDSQHQAYYQDQLLTFKKNYGALSEKIQLIKKRYRGTPVIATEPVFNEMAKALGLNMYGRGFQISLMNGSEPSISDIRDFENKLVNRQVKVLIYNNQVSNPTTERMQKIAEKSGVAIVGVSESEPAEQSYFTWMSTQLDALSKALQDS